MSARTDDLEEHSPRTKRTAAVVADKKRCILDQFLVCLLLSKTGRGRSVGLHMDNLGH